MQETNSVKFPLTDEIQLPFKNVNTKTLIEFQHPTPLARRHLSLTLNLVLRRGTFSKTLPVTHSSVPLLACFLL